LARGVQTLEPAVEAKDAEHVERGGEEAIALRLGLDALEELPDLASDRGHHAKQVLIGLANREAEELQHAQDLALLDDWEAERAVEPFALRDRRAGEVRIRHGLLDPGGRRGRPAAAGEPDAAREGEPSAERVELGERDRGRMPGIDAADDALPPPHPPQGSVRPPQALADGL